MAQVPQSTLRYLFYDVLKVQPYRDPNRTYSDLVTTLQRYPSITLKGTKEYVFENGAPQLLLYLGGVLPVSFRGTLYHFPILIWVPYTYPYDAPMIYVDPSGDIVVNPGQHVASDGKVYHSYLAHWRDSWDKSNIVDFLSILSDVFAKEPPVRSKPRQSSQQHPPPPPRPPLPHEAPAQRHSSAPQSPRAPPPPPKENGATPSPASPRPGRYDAPLPLPGQTHSPRPVSMHQQPPPQPRPQSQYQPTRSTSLRQSHPQQPLHWQQPPPQPQQQQQQQQPYPQHQPPQQPLPGHQQRPTHHQPHPPHTSQQPRPSQQQPKSQPGPSLLDSPFGLTLQPSAPTNVPAPPIPRNPEKDALLSHLSNTLTTQLHQLIHTNNTKLPALHAQHTALTTTQQNLQSELSHLSTLQSSLQSNITALTTSLSSADASIADARSRAKKGEVPQVDAMLTTPHIVSQQLYTLVAEERGIEAALWGLQEALIRGRVAGEVWARKTRELAREGFRKRWLVRKVGRGWGLDGA